jgi:hypothetical protein
MKKMYRNTMRRVARFILGFERCPADCKRSFMNDLWELFLKLFCVATFVFLLMVMAVVWA